MWKRLAIVALGFIRKVVKLNGVESQLWDDFVALLKSL